MENSDFLFLSFPVSLTAKTIHLLDHCFTIILKLFYFILIIVPIIPVYLNVDKPTSGSQLSDNSTKNNTSISSSSSVDSSMDFKIGALFASKAFVQVV